jgi:hypothetical protein
VMIKVMRPAWNAAEATKAPRPTSRAGFDVTMCLSGPDIAQRRLCCCRRSLPLGISAMSETLVKPAEPTIPITSITRP